MRRIARRHVLSVLAVLVAVGVGAFFLRPGPNRREGSVEVRGARVDVRERTPRTYRITYRVESYAGDAATRSTEDLLVRRPFEGRLETRSGQRQLSVTVNAFGRLRSDRAVFAVAPAPASVDKRPDAFLLDAQRAGFAGAREVRRVAGRNCRIFRTEGPAAGPLKKVSDEPSSYREQCFDEAGLLLEEVSVVDGDVATRRVAVRVTENARVVADSFEVGEPSAPVRQGGGSVQKLRAGSRTPGEFWEPERSPAGFDHRGRYAVIPPQAGFDDPLERGRIVAFISDVWVDGVDVIVVEQGSTLAGSAPFARAPEGIDVRLGELGRGQLVYNPSSAEIRVLFRAGRFVRIFGTVPSAELVDVARSLEKVEGGTVVVDDRA